MIFDFIKWDEHNLDHAPPAHRHRDRASDLNADQVRKHRVHPGRVLFFSVTDGGKKAVVVAQVVRDGDGVRPITAWEEE